MKHFKAYMDRIQSFLRHRKETLSFFGINQYVDWYILLVLHLCAFIVCVIISSLVYVYVAQLPDAFDISSESVAQAPIDEKFIDTVLEAYIRKEVDFEILTKAPYGYPSPER